MTLTLNPATLPTMLNPPHPPHLAEKRDWSDDLASRLAMVLSDAGESQADLARLTGKTTGAVNQWMKGKTAPNLSNMLTIAQHYGVSIDWLLGMGPPVLSHGRRMYGRTDALPPQLDTAIRVVLTLAAEQQKLLTPDTASSLIAAASDFLSRREAERGTPLPFIEALDLIRFGVEMSGRIDPPA